VVNN